MNRNAKLKLTAILIFFVLAVGIGTFISLSFRHNQVALSGTDLNNKFGWSFPVTKFPLTGSGPGQLAYSDIRDPGGMPQGLPVRLKIPIIGVDSAIEDAFITPDGRMDVPEGSVDVAWFALGPHPGAEGSAVIGGHFGIQNGVPFVFYDLDKLRIGDKIYIVDDKNETIEFIVRSIVLFDRNADATTVFTSEDGLAHLNLITCEGIWNQVNGTYPKRRVVFADSVSTNGALAPSTSAFHRLLYKGSQGSDVELLQTILIQEGFLTLPEGVPKGFFGTLTSIALEHYQTSVGLQPVGIFGPLTRAKFIVDSMKAPLIPNAGVNNGGTPPNILSDLLAPPAPTLFMQTMKILFATSRDGLITTLLLLAIAYMMFKIIKR